MQMGIDESRTDDLAGGVDGPGRIRRKTVTHIGDPVAFKGNDAGWNAMMSAIGESDDMAILDDGCQVKPPLGAD